MIGFPGLSAAWGTGVNGDERLIPLYSAGGYLLGHFDEIKLATIPGVELTYNRRGHPKRARMIPLVCIVDISHGRTGMHKIQTLECGRIHALIGTIGSED